MSICPEGTVQLTYNFQRRQLPRQTASLERRPSPHNTTASTTFTTSHATTDTRSQVPVQGSSSIEPRSTTETRNSNRRAQTETKGKCGAKVPSTGIGGGNGARFLLAKERRTVWWQGCVSRYLRVAQRVRLFRFPSQPWPWRSRVISHRGQASSGSVQPTGHAPVACARRRVPDE